MGRLNISPNLFLGVTELNKLQEFLKAEGGTEFLNAYTSGVLRFSSDTNFMNFRIEAGTNVQTVKLENESLAIDSQGRLIRQTPFDNLQILLNETWYWVKITYNESTFEQGTVSIAANGTLTGTGTQFSNLRGGKYHASKIKFESSINPLEYNVVEVVNDTNATLIGDFTAESNLKYSVVGTFTPSAVPTTQEKYPLRYSGCALTLVQESTLNTSPSLIEGTEFVIARVRRDGDTVTVQDKRGLNIFKDRVEFTLTNPKKENPLCGLEAIKFQGLLQTRDRNVVEFAFTMRSENWTFDSSLNRITIVGGLGGKFKNTEDFTNGDFDGWRLYYKDGSYSRIRQSTLSGTQINLLLDELDVDKLSDTEQELVVAPDIEEFCLKIVASVQTPISEIRYNFPANTSLCTLEIPAYRVGESTSSYTFYHRAKENGVYTEWELIPDDSAGYISEFSFNTDGSQKEGISRVPYTSGLITINNNGAAYGVIIEGKANKTQSSWINISLINGWAVRNGRTPQYMRDEFGFIHLRGALDASGSTNVQISTLPVGFRPPDAAGPTVIFVVSEIGDTGTHKIIRLSINTSTGALSVVSSTYNTDSDLNLDGVQFDTRSF